jgi:dihydrofolate reductase
MIKAILACDEEWGIGKDGDLPWPKNSDDLRWFKECTKDQAIVMGRKTWESLPRQPLPGRINLVISSNWIDYFDPKPHGVYGGNVKKIIKHIIEPRYFGIDDIWIIGGAQLVEACLPIIDEFWLSRIPGTYDCDTFLPKTAIELSYELYSSEWNNNVYVDKWRRIK